MVYFRLAMFPTLLAFAVGCITQSLPVVDLGYERHRALFLDDSDFYHFNNIRYAAPPLGDLRWRAPVPPAENTSEIQTGETDHICPQAMASWRTNLGAAFHCIHDITTNCTRAAHPDKCEWRQLKEKRKCFEDNIPPNITFPPPKLLPSNSTVPNPKNTNITEDCLFLDVTVPKPVFHRAQSEISNSAGQLAPVFVWIFGGGYAEGDKNIINTTGLISRAMQEGSEGIVSVSINYRLGAFGWLAGGSLTKNGTANAGLYDQRFALEWVQKHIKLFGGDPERVTVGGESAGGGSVLHQITAYGGDNVSLPFHQAIVQSPGWFPIADETQQEETLQDFFTILGVNTIDEARNQSTNRLIAANSNQIKQSSYGTFTYGPVVDGSFVPQFPGQLLEAGSFNHNVTLMVGHNTDEGALFTNPELGIHSASLDNVLKVFYPDMNEKIKGYVGNNLYPYPGYYFHENFYRIANATADLVFQCNAEFLARALENQTYAYMFDIFPAFHSIDIYYTFYSGEPNPLVRNETAAFILQDYLTSFIENGKPVSRLGPVFPLYGTQPQGQLLNISQHEIIQQLDPTNNARCAFWQSAPNFEIQS